MEIGKNRQPWINCLKLVCTFLIVMQHSISDAWITLDLYKASWLSVSILMTIAKEGVPLFFMCSGYGMLKRQRSIKECIFSVLRILIVYTAWMCVYGLIDAYFAAGAGQSVGVILKSIVKPVIFGHYHTWFLFVLMGLYLMTPILYPVMQNKNTALYAVIISAIATIVVNMMWDIKGISRFDNTLLSFDLSYLAGDILYYLLGYYLGTYIPSGKKKTILKWMGICCIVIGIAINIATVYYDRIKGEISGIFFDDKRIPGCLFVICIFLVFESLNYSDKTQGLLEKAAALGFPIYLMHPLILELLSRFRTGRASDIIVGIAVYLICMCVSLIIYRVGFTRFLLVTGKKP